jgi:hypothetical protein
MSTATIDTHREQQAACNAAIIKVISTVGMSSRQHMHEFEQQG